VGNDHGRFENKMFLNTRKMEEGSYKADPIHLNFLKYCDGVSNTRTYRDRDGVVWNDVEQLEMEANISNGLKVERGWKVFVSNVMIPAGILANHNPTEAESISISSRGVESSGTTSGFEGFDQDVRRTDNVGNIVTVPLTSGPDVHEHHATYEDNANVAMDQAVMQSSINNGFTDYWTYAWGNGGLSLYGRFLNDYSAMANVPSFVKSNLRGHYAVVAEILPSDDLWRLASPKFINVKVGINDGKDSFAHYTGLRNCDISLFVVHGQEDAHGNGNVAHITSSTADTDKYTQYRIASNATIRKGQTVTFSMASARSQKPTQFSNGQQFFLEKDYQPDSDLSKLPPFIKSVWISIKTQDVNMSHYLQHMNSNGVFDTSPPPSDAMYSTQQYFNISADIGFASIQRSVTKAEAAEVPLDASSHGSAPKFSKSAEDGSTQVTSQAGFHMQNDIALSKSMHKNIGSKQSADKALPMPLAHGHSHESDSDRISESSQMAHYTTRLGSGNRGGIANVARFIVSSQKIATSGEIASTGVQANIIASFSPPYDAVSQIKAVNDGFITSVSGYPWRQYIIKNNLDEAAKVDIQVRVEYKDQLGVLYPLYMREGDFAEIGLTFVHAGQFE
jgi:hypothetical protein